MKPGLITICLVILVTSVSINAATIYTNPQDWLDFVGWNYGVDFEDENFNDNIIDPGIEVLSDNGGIYPGVNWLGPDNVWQDSLGLEAVTVWTFDYPIYAFGAFWDLTVDGGPGAGIRVYLNETLVDYEIPDSIAGYFWGVTSTTPFDTVTLVYGNNGYDHQVYEMDNMGYAYMPLEIDIHPGSEGSSINPKSKGLTPVAIHTTCYIDAAEIFPETVTLEGIYPAKWSILDCLEVWDPYFEVMTGDGDLDLVLYFGTRELADALSELPAIMESGNAQATLSGLTQNGIYLSGTDDVTIVGSDNGKKKFK